MSVRTAKVTYTMTDESGGSCTGIVRSGIFTDNDIKAKKHESLIEGINLISGCSWDYSINWIVERKRIKKRFLGYKE